MVLINLNQKQMCHCEWTINPHCLISLPSLFNLTSTPIYYFLGSNCRQMLSFFLFKAQIQKWNLQPRSKWEVHQNSHINFGSPFFNKFILTFSQTLVTYNGFGTIVLIHFSDKVIVPNGVSRWCSLNWFLEEELFGGRQNGQKKTLNGISWEI